MNWFKYIDFIIIELIFIFGFYWALKFMQAIKTDKPIEKQLPQFSGLLKLTENDKKRRQDENARQIEKLS